MSCRFCNAEFNPKYHHQVYCSPTCCNKRKSQYRNKNKKKRKLTTHSLKGFQFDHIIPIKHPNVSGLHVPWNLQLLTPEENVKKSNSFDGTYENLGWKSGNR